MKYVFPVCLIALLFFSSIISCKKDTIEKTEMGYSYFPQDIGHYVVYDVDSFFYNDFTKHIDTFKFQLKEKIESVFLDNEGRFTTRIERYVRYFDPQKPFPSIPWKLRNVWTSNRTTANAERVEENIRYVKLIFPVTTKSIWDGNSQNTLGALNYRYLFVNIPQTIGAIKFDSVLQVTQQDETSLVSKKSALEKYVAKVGLAYKHVIDVQSQPNGIPDSLLPVWIAKPIMERITSGYQYVLKINSYGNE